MRFVALSVVFVILLASAAAPAAVADARLEAADLPGGDAAPVESASLDGPTTGDRAALTALSEPPPTEFAVRLREDRSAEWQVTVTYRLETENETDAFREVAAAFEEGESVGPDVRLFQNFAGLASEHTGRDMRIENVERSSSLDDGVGELRLSFTWTEFLKQEGERLVFNDAMRTPENDTWLTSIGENQRLRIETPDGYAITSANVAFSDNTVVIEGPHVFDSEELVYVTYEESGAFGGPTWELLGAALVIAAALVAGALLLRRDDREAAPPATNGGVERAPERPNGELTPTAEPEPEPDPEEDLSLLSDEERVERMLERNGGRMRQANIVKETGWSDAKVSQLLSAMAEEGEVEKLRIGRENLISLPDVDAFGPRSAEEDADSDGRNGRPSDGA